MSFDPPGAKPRVLALTQLLGVDAVLEQALLAAEALDGEVVLVHALDLGAEDMPAAFARALAACELAAARHPRVSRTFVLRFETPVQLLCTSAEEMDAVLAVIGAEFDPGSVVRGALREYDRPMWLARGQQVRRVVSPAGLELVETLRAGLAVERVEPDAPHAEGDLKVVDTRGLPVLSRLDRVQATWKGPHELLIVPSRRAAPVGNAG